MVSTESSLIDCDLEVDIAIEIRPGEVRCPRCFRSDLAPSLPRGWRDALMRKWGRIPRHCRACGKRFYVKQPATGEN